MSTIPLANQSLPVNLSATGQIVPPASHGGNQCVVVQNFLLMASATCTITFYDGNPSSGGVAISGPISLVAGTPIGQAVPTSEGARPMLMKTSVTNGLYLSISGSATVGGYVGYFYD